MKLWRPSQNRPEPAALLNPQRLRTPLGVVLIAGLGLLLVSSALGPFQNLELANMAYLFCALAGLTILTGLNGQISLGHGALMAIGAYATALLIDRSGWAMVPALLGAVAVTTVAGVVIGAAAARLRGPYLAGATIALAVGLPGLADRFPKTFGGQNGLTIAPPAPPEWLGSEFPLERWQAWIACAGALLVYWLLANLNRSHVGRAFRAVRDDEVAAELSGLHVARIQTLAFVISAGCAGLAGGLLVVVTSLAAPGAFDLALSLALLTGIVLGGLGSLPGAAWGAIALVLVPSWINNIAERFSVSIDVKANLPLAIYGLVLIGVMIAAPTGIQGAFRALGDKSSSYIRQLKKKGA